MLIGEAAGASSTVVFAVISAMLALAIRFSLSSKGGKPKAATGEENNRNENRKPEYGLAHIISLYHVDSLYHFVSIKKNIFFRKIFFEISH